MGLSSFPSPTEGVLPVLVMNTVLSVTLLKNILRSVLQMMGADWSRGDYEQDPDEFSQENARERRISITKFKSMRRNSEGSSGNKSSEIGNWGTSVECCVCLCGFQAEEEVSELSCKHFFHRRCLDKWFDNKHGTCPLCRSTL